MSQRRSDERKLVAESEAGLSEGLGDGIFRRGLRGTAQRGVSKACATVDPNIQDEIVISPDYHCAPSNSKIHASRSFVA